MTSSAHTVDEQQVAQTVHLERARVFNDRLVASAYVSPPAIGFVIWLQSVAAGAQRATQWGFLILSVIAMVIGFGYGYRKATQAGRSIQFWLHAQLVCCGLLGLAWGAATWFVWSADYFLSYITTLCVLVGVTFICMVVMAPMRWAIVPFSIGISLVPLLQLLFINNPSGLEIAVGWTVMLAIELRYSMELRKELVRQIDSSVRNVILVDRLTEVSRELTRANAVMDARNVELNVVMERLNQLVTFDQLTGAYSRRHFMQELDRQVALGARHGATVALIMFDLDHFKRINDQYGHAAGDRVLREATSSVQAELRDGDMLGRVGGEEFLVLLPMTSQEAAMHLAERLRLSVTRLEIIEGSQTIRTSASFGVAELNKAEDANSWFKRADRALYQAKSQGRNRVVGANES